MRDRRQFLFGASAMILALPSTVNLKMRPFLYADGAHDDTDALNAFFRGEPVEIAPGVIHEQRLLSGGKFLISDTVVIGGGAHWDNAAIKMTDPNKPYLGSGHSSPGVANWVTNSRFEGGSALVTLGSFTFWTEETVAGYVTPHQTPGRTELLGQPA